MRASGCGSCPDSIRPSAESSGRPVLYTSTDLAGSYSSFHTRKNVSIIFWLPSIVPSRSVASMMLFLGGLAYTCAVRVTVSTTFWPSRRIAYWYRNSPGGSSMCPRQVERPLRKSWAAGEGSISSSTVTSIEADAALPTARRIAGGGDQTPTTSTLSPLKGLALQRTAKCTPSFDRVSVMDGSLKSCAFVSLRLCVPSACKRLKVSQIPLVAPPPRNRSAPRRPWADCGRRGETRADDASPALVAAMAQAVAYAKEAPTRAQHADQRWRWRRASIPASEMTGRRRRLVSGRAELHTRGAATRRQPPENASTLPWWGSAPARLCAQ